MAKKNEIKKHINNILNYVEMIKTEVGLLNSKLEIESKPIKAKSERQKRIDVMVAQSVARRFANIQNDK